MSLSGSPLSLITRPQTRTSTLQFAEVEDDDASVDRSAQNSSYFRSSEGSSSSSESSGNSETEDADQDEEAGKIQRSNSKKRSSFTGMRKSQMSTTRVASILKGFNFFQNYDAKVVSKLAQLVTQATHPEGTVIFRQNDPPGNCYALVSGQVGVFVNIPTGPTAEEDEVEHVSAAARAEARTARRQSINAPAPGGRLTRRTSAHLDEEMAAILAASKPTVEGFSMYYPELDLGTKVATLQPGSLVGELALLHDQKRSASLKCLQDTSMIIIHRREFENVLKGEMQRAQHEKETFLLGHVPGLRNLPARPVGRVRPHPSYYFQRSAVAKGHEFLKQGQVEPACLHIVFHGTVERRRSEAKSPFKDPLAEATRLAAMKPLRASAEASMLAARKASRPSTPARPQSAASRGLPLRQQLGRSGATQLSDIVRRVGTLQVGGMFGSLPIPSPEPFTVVATSAVEVFSITSDLDRLPRKLIDTIHALMSKSLHLQLQQLHCSRFATEAPGLFQKAKPPDLGLGLLYWQVTPVLPQPGEKETLQLARRPQSATRNSLQPVRRASAAGKRPQSAPNARNH